MDYIVKNLSLCEIYWARKSIKMSITDSIILNIKSSNRFFNNQLQIIRNLNDNFASVFIKKWENPKTNNFERVISKLHFAKIKLRLAAGKVLKIRRN